MSPDAAPARGDLALVRRLAREARPYRRHIVGIFLLGLLAAPLALLVPVPLQVIADSVISDRPLPSWIAALVPDAVARDPHALLAAACVAVVLVAALIHTRAAVYQVVTPWLGARLVLRLRSRLFDHLQRLSLAFHDRQDVVDSLYRVQSDAWCIEVVFVQGLTMLRLLLQVVLVVAVIAVLDASLLWIALAAAPVLVACVVLFRRHLRRRWARSHRAESEALSVVGESLRAVHVVQAFGLEGARSASFVRQGEHAVQAGVSAYRAQAAFDWVVGLVAACGAAALLWVGGRHVLAGSLTPGALLLVVTYVAQLYRPLRELGTQVAQLQRALASVDRVFAVIDQVPTVAEPADARPMRRATGAFSLQGVSFGYDDDQAPVLHDVDLEIPAGATVEVAGRTGAGKSSLLSLLPRFRDPQEGSVRLDGVDVRALRLGDLRQQFSIVLQEDLLFSGTVRENIAVGDPDACDERIEQAARAAAAHDFIKRLPDGYDTGVGERGSQLSGGERQRLALARAFLRDAPVLILDEPTSALDLETEAQVLGALRRLAQGRTTFLVAHRVSRLLEADVRVVVEGGRLRVEARRFDEVAPE